MSMPFFYSACHVLIIARRGCASFVGRDVNKLKAKGGGKFKYMSENDMLELAEKFRPYRYVALDYSQDSAQVADTFSGVYLCGICGGWRR